MSVSNYVWFMTMLPNLMSISFNFARRTASRYFLPGKNPYDSMLLYCRAIACSFFLRKGLILLFWTNLSLCTIRQNSINRKCFVTDSIQIYYIKQPKQRVISERRILAKLWFTNNVLSSFGCFGRSHRQSISADNPCIFSIIYMSKSLRIISRDQIDVAIVRLKTHRKL